MCGTRVFKMDQTVVVSIKLNAVGHLNIISTASKEQIYLIFKDTTTGWTLSGNSTDGAKSFKNVIRGYPGWQTRNIDTRIGA